MVNNEIQKYSEFNQINLWYNRLNDQWLQWFDGTSWRQYNYLSSSLQFLKSINSTFILLSCMTVLKKKNSHLCCMQIIFKKVAINLSTSLCSISLFPLRTLIFISFFDARATFVFLLIIICVCTSANPAIQMHMIQHKLQWPSMMMDDGCTVMAKKEIFIYTCTCSNNSQKDDGCWMYFWDHQRIIPAMFGLI